MIYQWKPSSRVPLDPQIAGERLEAIRVHHGGALTPSAVVEDARPETSPLHPAFEWNDTAAASLYREEQAKYMIRSIAIVIERPETELPHITRAFVSVQQDRERVYTALSVVLSDTELRHQHLRRAMMELHAWKERYREMEELAGIFAALDGEELEHVGEHHLPSDVRRQYAAQQGRCFYCTEPLDGIFHTEHKMPRSRGGSNGAGNLVVSCPTCNLEKGTRTAEEFAAARQARLGTVRHGMAR